MAFDLWFYDVHNGERGAMLSHFTAFGIVQPWWSHSGYVILYATARLYAGRCMYDGLMTPQLPLIIWGAKIIVSCAFEMIGTGWACTGTSTSVRTYCVSGTTCS